MPPMGTKRVLGASTNPKKTRHADAQMQSLVDNSSCGALQVLSRLHRVGFSLDGGGAGPENLPLLETTYLMYF